MARRLTEPSRTIEGRRACGGERVLDGLWATYIPGALGAGRLALDCNGGIGCARAAGAGRDEQKSLKNSVAR